MSSSIDLFKINIHLTQLSSIHAAADIDADDIGNRFIGDRHCGADRAALSSMYIGHDPYLRSCCEIVVSPPRVVRIIEPTISVRESVKTHYRVLRVAAYCRVSTKQEEQLNSYENQVEHYTERINSENGWTLEGIYADKGISGTSVKNRDEFNRMIRRCKQGKIDMIITKSIARFARNTVDCLKYVRLLNDLGVDVYFEEQGIHSNQPGAEFYITIYGSIAQSESENISANIKWGKAQAAREGKVVFRYKNFLGYRKGEDGQPEIVPEEAETIRFIYDRFLAGDSLKGIAKLLEEKGIKSPTGKAEW